jgi:DNA-binding NarL/FixJ family response regulator
MERQIPAEHLSLLSSPSQILLKGEGILMYRTLIVEDSNFYRQLLKETLQSRFPKMEIQEAGDGEEAVRKITGTLPHLIFIDIKLPGESGLELTRRIKAQYPDTTVIILTSYDLPEYREAANQYQANYFLSKGTTTKESIVNLVESIIAGWEKNAS